MTEQRNAATQAVLLWIDSDEQEHARYADLARQALKESQERAGEVLGEWIEGEVQGRLPEIQKDLYGMLYDDLFSIAFQTVDWGEIAASYLEEVETDAQN